MVGTQLTDLELFANLAPQQLEQITGMVKVLHFAKDQKVFQQGEKARYLYIVAVGEVIIQYKPYDGPAITVARLAPGGVFGWSAALGHSVYTSAALTTCDVTVLRFLGKELQNLCNCDPETGFALLQRLANVIGERLMNTQPQILSILAEGMDSDSEQAKRLNQNDLPK
jgi:CRP-like cAMP-binding protein